MLILRYGSSRGTFSLAKVVSVFLLLAYAMSSASNLDECIKSEGLLAARSSGCSSGNVNQNTIRLPRTVKPHHYDIELLPNIEEGNFSIIGKISIDVECMKKTDRIILHSADIAIDALSVIVSHFKDFSLLPLARNLD